MILTNQYRRMLCAAVLAATSMNAAALVNGSSSVAWPGMGSIVIFIGQSYVECSGTVIAPNWVLTTGSCLDTSGAPQFTMAFDYLAMNAVYYTADASYLDPEYVSGSALTSHNVGLLHFPTPLPASPVRLNDNATQTHVGDTFQFIGYGQTTVGPAGSDNNTHRELGNSAISAVGDHELQSDSGSRPCFGDSGSAWFRRNNDGFPLVLGVQSRLDGNCDSVSYADVLPDVLPFISNHVSGLCLRSTVGAPCDGIFRNDLEAAP